MVICMVLAGVSYALASALAQVLGPRRPDGGLNIFHFLGRRQYGLQAQRFKPQLSGPSLGVIEMFVFLVFDFFVRSLQRLGLLAFQLLRRFAD